jgi:2-amino-4-hydroxy-6-hydroxymethyldihydropteridine diphosphokinase
VSRVYECEPVDAPGTPDFLNAAVLVRTRLPPDRLKHRVLRPLETRLGRVRTEDSHAPRTIDIDIAVFGELRIDDPETGLSVPDPAIARLAHLAFPLRDIAPLLVVPGVGLTLAELARRLEPGCGIRLREDLDLLP